MRPYIIATIIFGLLLAVQPAAATGDGEGAAEHIAAPPLGVKPALRQGLFTDLQLGTFFTMNPGGAGRTVSNAQPYVGVGVGYDLSRNIVAGAGFSYGASSGVCFEDGGGYCLGARSFSVLLFNAYAGYLHSLDHQWYLGGKVMGGAAMMTPMPEEGSGDLLFGYNGGIALTTEYHTHLEHFVLGLDVAATFVMGGRQIGFPGIAIYPRLKYVF